MKTYKGIIKIDCKKGRKPCPRKIAGNSVQVECPACEFAMVRVVDLEDEDLFLFPPVKPIEKIVTEKPTKKKGD